MTINLRTWDAGKRCDECCNGDRCDDPTHYERKYCPHCKGTGWAIWTDDGRKDFLLYLNKRHEMTEDEAIQYLNKLFPTKRKESTMKIGFIAQNMTHAELFVFFSLTLDSLSIHMDHEEKQKHFEMLLLSFAAKLQP